MSTKDVALKNTGIEIIKPKCDQREYEFFTLPNDMDVLLVSDSKSDTAAAALAVNVGSLSDPKEALGNFHLLEHMLFMGSKKFPNETDYPNFIAAHGGMSNAWTAATETVYYFDIDSSYLDGALDRFAQFFIGPLFNQASTDRELNAVHSEHDKNVYNDAWRGWDANRFVFHDDHPAQWFHTGNLATLRDEPLKAGTDIRSIMLAGHKKYYSSNLMKLCIVGKQSLSELRQMAITHFTSVKNSKESVPKFSTKVLRDSSYVIELCPIKHQRSIEMNWFIPSDLDFTETQPLNILSHAFGDEGPKSILSLLKAKRYASGLSSGRATRAEFGCMFSLTIEVTETGIANLHDIVRIIYAGINIMGKKTDDEWLRMCTEAQKIDINNFNTREPAPPADAATNFIGTMFTHPPKYCVVGEAVLQTINIDHIRQFLKYFTLENNWFIVRAQDATRDIQLFSDNTADLKDFAALDKVEKVKDFANEDMPVDELNQKFSTKKWVYNEHYKNRYNKYPLSKKLCEFVTSGLNKEDLDIAIKNEPLSYALCTDCEELIDLPAPNPFIPDHFDLLTFDDHNDIPNQNDLTQHTAKAVYICSDEVSQLPLDLKNEDEKEEEKEKKIMNSIFNNGFYNTVSSSPLNVDPPTDIKSLRTLIEKMVNDNLIGFDKEHVNIDSATQKEEEEEEEKTEEKTVSGTDRDEITEDVIKQIFGRTDALYGKSLPPAVEVVKADGAGGDDDEDKEGKEGKEGEEEGKEDGEDQDENDGHEDEDGDEDNEDESATGATAGTGAGKLWNLNSFFTERDEKSISQFIPPQQIPIPLPSRHFQITNSRRGRHSSGNGSTNNGIAINSTPIVPPIECYYKFTDTYNSPNVEIHARIDVPGINPSFLALYIRAVNELLSEKLYPSALCGIQRRINETTDGIAIYVAGHRQGSAETYNTIIQSLLNPLLFNEDLFTRVMDKYQRALLSVPMTAAYQQCGAHTAAITNKNVLHNSQKFENLQNFITDMNSYVKIDYLRKHITNSQIMIIGNTTRPYAIRLAQNTAIVLDLKENLVENLVSQEPVSFPDGSNTIALLPNGNPLDNQNGLFTFYLTLESFRSGFSRTAGLLKLKKRGLYQEPIDEKNNNNLDLVKIENGQIFSQMSFYGNILYNYFISHLMSDHSFDSLRTKQQLGYIAQSRHHYSTAGYGLGFIIQSSHQTSYVDSRIEYYLRKELKEYITTDPKCILDKTSFISNLIGAQKGLLQRFNSLDSEGGFFSGPIFSRLYDWYRPIVLGLMMPYVHRHVILGYFNKWFCDLSQRRKLGIHITAQTTPSSGAVTTKDQDKNQDDYQKYMEQDVLTDLDSVLGMKMLLPGAKF